MKRSSTVKSVILSLFVVLMLSISSVGAQEFPYREKYPEIKPISTQDLHQKYNAGEIIIVDVRSDIEFQVIHPKKAVHISLGNMNFVQKVGDLIKQNLNKQIAFYCNGITCLKSYEATKKAQAAGFNNCFAYDAGIPAWAEAYPGLTLLIGKEVVNPQEQLIPKSEFKKICLSFDDFKNKADSSDAIVVDVRDNIQKNSGLPGLEAALNMPLDKFIANFVQRKINQDKTLLIFDQVGKQVRWLMYYLVQNDYKNFYFLNKGATEVLKTQEYK